MPLADYCHVVDVLRKFNPQLTEGNLDSAEFIGNADTEQVRARIDSVGSTYDGRSVAARLLRSGAPGNPETYEKYDAPNRGWDRQMVIDLDGRNVLPFDAAEGDVVEVRTGRDQWEDITADVGDDFVLESGPGRINIYRRLFGRIYFEKRTNRFLRVSYRYGGLGGARGRGGQTTLDGQIDDTTTSVSVANAGRLPDGGIMLIGNDEYVRVTNVDYGTDTLTVERGARATAAASHADGAVVHYCPESLRDAVAGMAAAELVRYDDWTATVVDGDRSVDPQQKIDDWEAAFDSACASASDVKVL
jgi:hypothetical protein